MSFPLQAQVGEQQLADGSPTVVRTTRSSATKIAARHATFHEAVFRGNVFVAANQAGTTYTLFSATTATGLILSNPQNSAKALAVWDTGYELVLAAAASVSALCLSAGANQNVTTHTTPLTIANCLIGSGNASIAKADGAATLPAAGVIVYAFHAPSVSATATTAVPPVATLDLSGKFIVAPGSFIQLAAVGTAPAASSVVGHLIWEEFPYP